VFFLAKEAPARWTELGPQSNFCKVAKKTAGGVILECPSNTPEEHVVIISAFNDYITIYRLWATRM
jgi:hypothetical protein